MGLIELVSKEKKMFFLTISIDVLKIKIETRRVCSFENILLKENI